MFYIIFCIIAYLCLIGLLFYFFFCNKEFRNVMPMAVRIIVFIGFIAACISDLIIRYNILSFALT